MAAFVARYARAFADVVTDAKLDTVALDAQLTDFVATWQGSSELRELFATPAVPARQKVEILDKLNARMGLAKELRNLLAVLIDNDRISSVVEVVEAFRLELKERQGIRKVEIVTARSISEVEQAELVAGVAKLAGSQIEPSFTVSPEILGGAVVRLGSTVYDGSVRGRLERLKEVLVAG